MTAIVTNDTSLVKTVAPALPVAPIEYQKNYHDQVNNILRLYFNQVDKLISQLRLAANGAGIILPFGAFHQDGTTELMATMSNTSTAPIVVTSTAEFPSSGWLLIGSEIISYTTKTPTTFDGTITRGVLGTTNTSHGLAAPVSEVQGTGSPTATGQMLFNNTDFSNGVAIDATDQTKVVFTTPGLYNIQFSAQLLNFTTADDNVTIWMQVNGGFIPASAGIAQVPPKHGGSPGATLVSWNLVYPFLANDYLQLAWASDTGNTVVATYPASTTAPLHPSSPGVILTATFASALS